jgi:hypothetical protein
MCKHSLHRLYVLWRQYTPSEGMYVLNLGVELPEDGVYDVQTCKSDVKLYICMYVCVYIWPVSRHHTQETRTNCRILHVAPEVVS